MNMNIGMKVIGPEQVNSWHDEGLNLKHMNREFRPRWSTFLASQMKAGVFDPTCTIAIANQNGTNYLVNGQHTLDAIRRSGVTIDLPLARYHNVTDDELVRLYTHYDIGLKRDFKDTLKAYKVTENTGFNLSYVNRIGAALKLMARGFSGSRGKMPVYIAHEQWVTPILVYSEAATLLLKATTGGDSQTNRQIKARGVMAVALVTLRDAPDLAAEFWKGVSHDDSLASGDPRKVLIKLLTLQATSHSSEKYSAHTMAYLTMRCWNRYAKGQTMKFAKPSQAMRHLKTIRIEKTRYRNGLETWIVNNKGELSGY